MWAMFVRVRQPDGKLSPWRFEGFQEHDERVTEIGEIVASENGENTFYSILLPE